MAIETGITLVKYKNLVDGLLKIVNYTGPELKSRQERLNDQPLLNWA